MNKNDGPDDLVELYDGLWITRDSQYLLWIYSLNEEDGIGAVKVASVIESDNRGENDEDSFDQFTLTIQSTEITTRDILKNVVPKLEIYPVLALRTLVLISGRIEFYISRIMGTGDRVEKCEGIKLVRYINYQDDGRGGVDDDPEYPIASTPPEPDQEPDSNHLLEAQIASLALIMKEYRSEEMEFLVHIGNVLGEAQSQCLEKSEFIQNYLARMQIESGEAV